MQLNLNERKLLKNELITLSKINDELKRCQEIYLNCCVNQIGSAHRLAQLIEKVEQITKSNEKSNLQGKKLDAFLIKFREREEAFMHFSSIFNVLICFSSINVRLYLQLTIANKIFNL